MTDTNRKVPGQISLSAEEFDWLNEKLRSRFSAESPDFVARFTRTLFAGLNQSRVGDAAGMVRRSVNGSIAVREQNPDTGKLSWNIVYLQHNDDRVAASRIGSEWPSIKDSTWHDRLVEQSDGGVA